MTTRLGMRITITMDICIKLVVQTRHPWKKNYVDVKIHNITNAPSPPDFREAGFRIKLGT